jgi:branched-chain amino acid aminotransferase
MREVRAARANEALVVDGEGRVVEGATSNLFVVHRGVLRTPGEDAGILPGITREGVLRAAARLGIAVEFETPTLDEVRAADEIMISSSIRELLAVVVLDGRPVGAGSPGPTYRRLLDGFRQLVRAEAPRME